MLTTTLQAFLDIEEWQDLDPDDLPLYLYRVYDDEITLWVGKSPDPFNQLHNNLVHRTSHSTLGPFYLENQTLASTWMVDFYTVEDCLPYIQQHMPEQFEKVKRQIQKDDLNSNCMETAKVALFLNFRPCLNNQGNPNPARLPEKYQR